MVFDAVDVTAPDSGVIAALHIPFQRHQDRFDLQRAHLEATRGALGIRHPLLAAVIDGGMDGVVWRVMERVVGWTVDDVLRRSRSRRVPIPTGVALAVLASTAEALDALHGLDRVHGRLSPARVLALPGGSFKVCGWMSPERQLRLSEALKVNGAVGEL